MCSSWQRLEELYYTASLLYHRGKHGPLLSHVQNFVFLVFACCQDLLASHVVAQSRVCWHHLSWLFTQSYEWIINKSDERFPYIYAGRSQIYLYKIVGDFKIRSSNWLKIIQWMNSKHFLLPWGRYGVALTSPRNKNNENVRSKHLISWKCFAGWQWKVADGGFLFCFDFS